MTVSLLLALGLAAVSGGEALRALMALRDGGSWVPTLTAVVAGTVFFLSLAVLLRIVTAASQLQRQRRLDGAIQTEEV